MKKGLMLTLVVLAAIALSAPVFANAPVVKPLPIIIMGDNGDDDGSGNYLMRYNDILSFGDDDYVLWRNDSYTSDAFHVYMLPLAGAQSTPTASTDAALVDNMSAIAYTDLVTSAILPPAAMDMTYYNAPGDQFWSFSLIDQYINEMAATPMTDSYTAAPNVHGVDRAATYGSSFAAATDVLIVAAVSSGTNKAVIDTAQGVGTTIWTIADADDGSTPTGIRKIFTSPAPSQTWYNGTYDSVRPLTVQGQTTTSGLGAGYEVTGAHGSLLTFGTWNLLMSDFSGFVLDHAGGGGLTSPVLECMATLQSSSSSPDLCPSWRLLAYNMGYTHFVGKHSDTYTGYTAAPYSGNPYVDRMYIATPYALTEMGDNEWLSQHQWIAPGSPDDANDGRNYTFAFDLHHPAGQGSDRGIFLITALDVYAFEQPAPGVQLGEWSGSGAFTDWLIENWAEIGGGDGQFYQGYYALGPSGTYLDLGAGTTRPGTNRMKKATSPWLDRVPFNGGTVVRKTTTVASEAPNRSPIVALHTQVYSSAIEFRGNYYIDYYGCLAGDLGKPQTAVSGFDAGGAFPPLATPTRVVCYHYMPPKQDSGDAMLFQVQAYSLGTYNSSDWGDDNGYIRMSAVAIDEVEVPEYED